MSTSREAGQASKVERADAGFVKLIGPGLIVAATGIGAGDVVSATVGGARYGEILLWGILLGAFFKYVLNEGVARFQLATGLTAIEGWAEYLPVWIRIYFGVYLVVWTVAVTAALANACGLGISNLTFGAVPQSWGAALHSLAGAAFVLLGGFSGFQKIMKVLVGAMFFAIIGCALATIEDGAAVASGLLLPRIPEGGGAYVLSLIGGIGGSVTLLSYNYWLREEGMATPRYVRFVKRDLALAYSFTAIFGISIMTMSSRAFHAAGIQITDGQAVTRLAEMLGSLVGPAGFYVYSIGFWAAVFAALLGVWQSVPYLYADFYAIWKKAPPEERAKLTEVGSVPYRAALAYVTLAPIPFAFAGRPLFIIVTYTIVGSLFLPFLATTLLWLHRRARWDERVPRNGWITTALLVLVLLLFLAIGLREIREAI
ncbi:MAG TPA: Nramp family divalent metal transporter [Vicinamibacteria bacterium]|nr:Nramp family divalent metal transporter [Vicinamibacteria bacterium]